MNRNRRVYFGKNDLRFLYYRYKDSDYYSLSIIITSILVCILLIWQVVIPQAEKYFSISRQVALEQSKLNTLKSNINYINNLDKSVLDSQFQTAIQALPIEKDFILILQALSDAALKSGVTLNDFTFNVEKENLSGSKTSLDLVIKVDGSVDRVKVFLREINEKLPIAEVTNVAYSLSSTTISFKFYYKIYPKIAYDENKPLAPISDTDRQLINKLSSWRVTSTNFPELTEDPLATSSSVPLFE